MVQPEEHQLGPQLKRLREAAELSQQELAFRSRVSMSMIFKLEQGRPGGLDPKLSTLMALARGLDITLNGLVDELFPRAQKRRKGK